MSPARSNGLDHVPLVVVAVAVLTTACSPATVGSPSPTQSPAASPSAVESPSASPTANPATTPSATPTGWQPAGSMVHPRISFPSVLLSDGTVLAVGDDGCTIAGAVEGSERAEVYQPSADRWTKVGSLNKPRGVPQLVALPDGTAMVLGGVNEQDEPFSSTKIYTPTDRAWAPGPLMLRADVQAAAALADGTIVSVGTDSTEILDPGASKWRRSTPPPKVFVERLFPLADETVLAAAEHDNEERDTAFLTFDPRREKWSFIAAPSLYDPEVVTLDGGAILALGQDEGGSRVERYDPEADRWSAAAPMRDGRVRAQLARLPDGRVLVAGGMSISSRAVDGGYSVTEDGVSDTTEIYDPASDSWTPGPSLHAPRQAGHAMPLPDGSMLVYGGYETWPESSTPDTGTVDCPPPIAETERLYVVP